MRDELLGRQLRPVEVVACQPYAAQVQLAAAADRDRVLLRIEDVALHIRDRLADGHESRFVWAAAPERRVHGRLRGTVEVVQLGRQLCEEPLLQIVGERFAAANHPLHAAALAGLVILQEDGQHRRHEVQGGDLLLNDQADEVAGIFVPSRPGQYQAAPVIKGQKNSQTETSKL